jgi:uncharacterized protein with PIN domain
MRFVCDEMLAGLARWLRAAGYDTVLAQGGQRDRELLDTAAAEDRILLTTDRALASARPAVRTVLLPAKGVDAQARAVTAALALDWSLAPFTRCVIDNTLLETAGPEALARMPGETPDLPGPFRQCPSCGRVYWPGSHVRRMQARMQAWAAAPPG